MDRVNIFDLLIAHNGTLTTSIIKESLNTNHHTAHRIMAELKAVELVDVKEYETQTEEKQMTLKHQFDWFTTDDFKELREGFEPTDNSEFIKGFCKKFKICLEEKASPCDAIEPVMKYDYSCYKCAKITTEPQFFKLIQDLIMRGMYQNIQEAQGYAIRIRQI